jgi:hypothetical protein
MDSLAMAFTSGWASGINSYLLVLVLGIAERLGVDDLPHVLGRWEVLAAAGVLYAMEFVADKVPYIDSTWDAVSTAIRPTVGAVIGVLLAGDASTLEAAVSGVLGGTTALASHSVKSGSRLAINTSPEPFTNVVASLGEDVTVLGVALVALHHPYVAASVAAVLLLVGMVVVYLVLKYVRRGWRRWKGKDRDIPSFA